MLVWISPGSLSHHLPESSLHLFSFCLLELLPHLFVVLLAIQVIHELLSEGTVVPALLRLVAAIVALWMLLVMLAGVVPLMGSCLVPPLILCIVGCVVDCSYLVVFLLDAGI